MAKLVICPEADRTCECFHALPHERRGDCDKQCGRVSCAHKNTQCVDVVNEPEYILDGGEVREVCAEQLAYGTASQRIVHGGINHG